MTFCDSALLSAVDLDSAAFAERLVVRAYRCAMGGLNFGDAECWKIGWRSLGEAVPPEDIGPLFGRFYSFARALLAAAQKPLFCRPISHPVLCAEEALALRMIETAQANNYVATLRAASDLLGAADLGDPLETAQLLASALTRHGLVLSRLPSGPERAHSTLRPPRAL